MSSKKQLKKAAKHALQMDQEMLEVESVDSPNSQQAAGYGNHSAASLSSPRVDGKNGDIGAIGLQTKIFTAALDQIHPIEKDMSNHKIKNVEDMHSFLPKARAYLANHGSQNILNTFIHSDLHELLFMQLLVDDQHELNMRYSQDQMLTALEEMYITATPTEFLAVKTELGTMAIVKGDSLHITKKQYQTLFAQIATFTRDKASAIEGIDPTVFVKLAITTCIPLEEAVEALLLKNFPDTKTLIRFVMGSPGKTGFIGFLVPMKYKPSDVGATKENPINKSTPYQYGYQHPRAAGGQQQHPEHMAAASTSLDPHVDKCPSCWGPQGQSLSVQVFKTTMSQR